MFVLKLFKWISGIASGTLSVLLLLYIGLKNENWAIADSDGRIVIDKATGISLIVVWAIVGALYLLFDFLHRKRKKEKANKNKIK